MDCSFIGFVTNEARNKLANSLCSRYSGTVCSLILSPRDLSKGHKLNKVKTNQLYKQNTIIKAFICYKEAVVKEALGQVLLCSKGKSTARCQTEIWNPAGEVFGARKKQHLCRNTSKLLENGKGVWCWTAESVSVALGPGRRSMWIKAMLWGQAQPFGMMQGFNQKMIGLYLYKYWISCSVWWANTISVWLKYN